MVEKLVELQETNLWSIILQTEKLNSVLRSGDAFVVQVSLTVLRLRYADDVQWVIFHHGGLVYFLPLIHLNLEQRGQAQIKGLGLWLQRSYS